MSYSDDSIIFMDWGVDVPRTHTPSRLKKRLVIVDYGQFEMSDRTRQIETERLEARGYEDVEIRDIPQSFGSVRRFEFWARRKP